LARIKGQARASRTPRWNLLDNVIRPALPWLAAHAWPNLATSFA